MAAWLRSVVAVVRGESDASPPPATSSSNSSDAAPVRVSLLAFNTYLLPPLMAGKGNATCTNQASRAAAIGAFVDRRAPDVVCLQEVWGAGMAELEAPLTKGRPGGCYRLLPWCASWHTSWIDTPLQWLSARGGLWMATLEPRARVAAAKWETYKVSDTKSRKGIAAARVEVFDGEEPASIAGDRHCSQAGSGERPIRRHLVVVNTHLDPTNENGSIVRQLRQLHAFVATLVRDDAFMGPAAVAGVAAPSGRGGVVGAAAGPPPSVAAAVVLVGDFNISVEGACEASRELRQLFGVGGASNGSGAAASSSATDLYGSLQRPALCQPTYDVHRNSLVMWNVSERIDLQLGIASIDGVVCVPVRCVNVEVVTQPKGSEMSDHWPVLLDLDVG